MNKPETNNAPVTPAEEVNLTPGYAVLLLSVIVVVYSLFNGVSLHPFGIPAIVACVFCALQIKRRNSTAPGYASLPLVVLIVSAGYMAAGQ